MKTMNGFNGFLKLGALAKMKMPLLSPLSYPVISQSEHKYPLASQPLADGPHNFVCGTKGHHTNSEESQTLVICLQQRDSVGTEKQKSKWKPMQ